MSIINLVRTEIEYEGEEGYAEIITHKGVTRAGKALVVMDNEYNGNYTVGMLNLTREDKERLFDILDAQLHEDEKTRSNLQQKVYELENAIEECSAQSALDIVGDYENDFSQNKI